MTKDDKLSLKEKDNERPPGATADDMKMMRKYLEMRSKCAEMLQVAPYATYRALHDKYIGRILGVVPEGMRAPTIQEVRRFDRTMREELLRWLSKDMGTLDNGLRHYINHSGRCWIRSSTPYRIKVWKNLCELGKETHERGSIRSQRPVRRVQGRGVQSQGSPSRLLPTC